MLAKIINDETKAVTVALGSDTKYFVSQGFTEMDVEQAYNGNWYLKGYAPEKPQEIKEQEVRAVREQYFSEYVDFYQSKPLYWGELDEKFKQQVSDYRNYLKDYTKQENWWEKNPLNFEEWKNDESTD